MAKLKGASAVFTNDDAIATSLRALAVGEGSTFERSNFDGGVYDDVLFRNVNTGQSLYVDMNGTPGTGGWVGVLGSLPAGWSAIDTADMTGDGRADAIVRNASNGALYAVSMTTGTAVWSIVVDNITSDWSYQAAGDFTNDGALDVLIRNSTTGQIWFLDIDPGGGHAGYTVVTSYPNGGARVVGAADVNNDGFSDIVIQDEANGQVYYFRGGALGSGLGYISGALGAEWVGVGLGDFDGDGGADVILRNSVTGQIWGRLGDVHPTDPSGWFIVHEGVGTAWNVAGVGDYDGDGYDDVAIQNASNGTTYYADMNAGAFTGWGYITGANGADWVVV